MRVDQTTWISHPLMRDFACSITWIRKTSVKLLFYFFLRFLVGSFFLFTFLFFFFDHFFLFFFAFFSSLFFSLLFYLPFLFPFPIPFSLVLILFSFSLSLLSFPVISFLFAFVSVVFVFLILSFYFLSVYFSFSLFPHFIFYIGKEDYIHFFIQLSFPIRCHSLRIFSPSWCVFLSTP